MANRDGSAGGLNGKQVQSRAPAQNQSQRRDRVEFRLIPRRTTPDDIRVKTPQQGLSRDESEWRLRGLIEQSKFELANLAKRSRRALATAKGRRP